MTNERLGELSLKVLVYSLYVNGVTIGGSFKRKINEVAKKLEIPNEEMEEFSVIVLQEITKMSIIHIRTKKSGKVAKVVSA